VVVPVGAAVLAIAVAGFFVPPYLVGGTTVPNLDRITPGYYTSLVIHAVPAGIALITGPWQFVSRLRTRFPRLHRVMGRVYLLSVVAAALAAVYSSAVTDELGLLAGVPGRLHRERLDFPARQRA
jgi:hypothetical protein